MKIYLVSRDVQEVGYDTYDSFVVIAKDEKDAMSFHPDGRSLTPHRIYDEWTESKTIVCKEIGESKRGQKRGVVLASFNAG